MSHRSASQHNRSFERTWRSWRAAQPPNPFGLHQDARRHPSKHPSCQQRTFALSHRSSIIDHNNTINRTRRTHRALEENTEHPVRSRIFAPREGIFRPAHTIQSAKLPQGASASSPPCQMRATRCEPRDTVPVLKANRPHAVLIILVLHSLRSNLRLFLFHDGDKMFQKLRGLLQKLAGFESDARIRRANKLICDGGREGLPPQRCCCCCCCSVLPVLLLPQRCCH